MATDFSSIRSLSLGNAIRQSTKYLTVQGIENPHLDARILLSNVLKKNFTFLLLNPDKRLTYEERIKFDLFVKRRLKKEPVAYIIGEKEFWSLAFKVTPETLIPRPETETLVEEALNYINQSNLSSLISLDIGTGCGNIPVALAYNRKQIIFFAIDSSFNTLKIARENARKHHVEKKINFVHANMIKSPFLILHKKPIFDMILSNPPYIRSQDMALLMPDVKCFEPIQALDGGMDGLFFYRKIIKIYSNLLKLGGRFILEMGYDQRDSLLCLIEKEALYDDIRIIKDLAGIERVISFRKKNG